MKILWAKKLFWVEGLGDMAQKTPTISSETPRSSKQHQIPMKKNEISAISGQIYNSDFLRLFRMSNKNVTW